MRCSSIAEEYNELHVDIPNAELFEPQLHNDEPVLTVSDVYFVPKIKLINIDASSDLLFAKYSKTFLYFKLFKSVALIFIVDLSNIIWQNDE